MTAEEAESLDMAILRVLDLCAGRSYGLGLLAIQAQLPRYGEYVDTDVVKRRLEYMADSEIRFAERVDKGQFNPANASWKITARGINHLRERGC